MEKEEGVKKGFLKCPICGGDFCELLSDIAEGSVINYDMFKELDGMKIERFSQFFCGTCHVELPIGFLLMHNDVSNEGVDADESE